MYVYVRDENVIHLRFTRTDDQTVRQYKQWFDMGHSPIVVKGEQPHEQAR